MVSTNFYSNKLLLIVLHQINLKMHFTLYISLNTGEFLNSKNCFSLKDHNIVTIFFMFLAKIYMFADVRRPK